MYQVSGMLRDAHDEVKKNYYDPKLHGVDWDARYQQYSAKLDKAHNLGEGFRVVAAFLSGLKDSLPSSPARHAVRVRIPPGVGGR
jgi:hypothetical protein